MPPIARAAARGKCIGRVTMADLHPERRPLIVISKSSGVTDTERMLAEFCERAFLKLWSYPNPYKDVYAQAPRGCRVVCVAVVALARYGHPLRFYITPHCPQRPPVAALMLRLVPVTASRPCGCRGTWALVWRCALCFGQWPAASHLVCAPTHPHGLARFAGVGPARSARPPPEGAPSDRAGNRRASEFAPSKVPRFGSGASPVLAEKKSATV